MKVTRLSLRVLWIAAVALTISCGESTPTGVSSAPVPNGDLMGSLAGGLGLLQCSPLPAASATQTVGPSGGIIRVGPHTLVIPSGALSQTVTITGVAPSGTVNAVRFSPQGLTFQIPASLTMSYANCSLASRLLPKKIAYTTDALRILALLPSLDLLSFNKVTAPLHHFSQYAVAW
jgi:hypothetical protein